MMEWTDGSCEKEEWFGINSKKMELDVLSDKTFFRTRRSFRCIVGKQDATNTTTLKVYNQTLVQCEHKS